MTNSSYMALEEFLARHKKLFVLTGAGISADSGIPTYRDHDGSWQRSDPIKHDEFLSQLIQRKRYWARSMVGWKHVQQATPNNGHRALAQIESLQRIHVLVTQNVDRLHQRAGSKKVIDLHGRLDRVICLNCGEVSTREDLQVRLEHLNPDLVNFVATALPDGDSDIDDYDMESIHIPHCDKCGGMLKPAVVFFGDNVPKPITQLAMNSLRQADAVLIVGSSLQVFSGYRFCKLAYELGTPIACINQGRTRADDLISIKLSMDCSIALTKLGQSLFD